MSIPYDSIEGAFLAKITEFELIQLTEGERTEILDGYMKRTVNTFKKICKYDLSLVDETNREFIADFEDQDTDEIIDIISEGMVVQWLKPYVYKQELLENVLNTFVCSVLE